MLYDPNEPNRYRWLRILLGAIFTVVVALLVIGVLLRFSRTWSPSGVVPIPAATPVNVIPRDHPRLVVNEAAIRALALSTSSPEYILLMDKADQFYDGYLKDPKQGDTIYPGYFALAYRVSGEDRYLLAARDMVLNVAQFPRWNRVPESSNFYKIELAYAVGLAYDLIYDEFSPAERVRIESNLSEVLDGLLWHMQGKPSQPFWMDAPNSNYYVAYHSAAGLLALCLGDRYPRWREALAFAYEGLQPSIDLLKRDGGWIEGLTYQDFAWGQHGLLFLNALRVNGGPNRLNEDWYERSVRFALAGILPSGTEQADFGDNISDPIASYGYLWRARSFFQSPFLEAFLAEYVPNPDYPSIPLDAMLIETLLRFDASIPRRPFLESQACQHFEGIEWVTLRQDWTNRDGFYMAMKAGYGGWDHNHVDQGSMIMAFGGRTFIADPGRGIFEDRKDARMNNIYGGPTGHSVFIPGIGPETGYWEDFSMYSANAAHRQADARITDFVDTPEQTSFALNLDGAYPAENLARWRRTVVWRRPGTELPGGAVMIVDDTDISGQVRFITRLAVSERTAVGYAREGRVIDGGEHQLGIWSWQEGAEIEYVTQELNADNLRALAIKDKSGAGLNNVITVLLPWDEIAHVVVGEDARQPPISVFVDGYLFEFRRNESGDWRMKAQ